MCGLAIFGLSKEERRILSRPEDCHRLGLILDPSCGVGSFLAEITNQLRNTLKIDDKKKDSWLNALLSNVVVGIDKSERMVRLALTNLAMFGFPMARLYLANSLSRNGSDGELTESLVGKARLILTNPPFGASFEGNDLVKYRITKDWSRRLPARIDSEALFFERYLDWLAPGGQLLAIVPDCILTNKGIFEDLRRGIAKEIELLGVISLPPEQARKHRSSMFVEELIKPRDRRQHLQSAKTSDLPSAQSQTTELKLCKVKGICR